MTPSFSFHRSAVLAALATALAAAVATPAHADTFALGTVSGPGAFSVYQSHSDPFEDVYTFTVAEGTSLAFSAFFNTPFSNRFWIDDLDGRLDRSGTTVLEAFAETVTLPPFPAREVTFPSHDLVAGDYAVRLTGTPTYQGPRSAPYAGTLTFSSAVAAPVPEPGALALAAAGLGVVGVAARRRRTG